MDSLDRVTAEICGDALARAKAWVQWHHDQEGDKRCWKDDLKLYYEVLGLGVDPYATEVGGEDAAAQATRLCPDADQWESCRRYVTRRQHPAVRGTYPMPDQMTIAELTEEVERLRATVATYERRRLVEGEL